MPLVSVIIPTYNHRDYVLQALESVFAQTFKDYEVIVVNDGSPDDTAETLRPMGESGRIRYIEQPNAGQAAARNRGLAEARGEFIAFLDDDDVWPADKLEWQVELLRNRPDVGMVAGEVADLGLAPCTSLGGPPRVPTFEMLFNGSLLSSPGQSLIRRGILQSVGGLNSSLWGADDYDLWFRICRITRIEKYQRTALFYRRHPLNASGNIDRMMHNCARVVELQLKHVKSSRRWVLRRRGYQWLYKYVGHRVLARLKGELRHGELRASWKSCRALADLVPGLIWDPKLIWWAARDTVPSRWQHRGP